MDCRIPDSYSEWSDIESEDEVGYETDLTDPADIPFTGDASAPDVSRGNALILVQTSRYELGAPRPKFSGLQAVPAYQRENRYLHTIILIYKLRKLSMLFPTSSSLTKMNLAY